MEMGGVWTLRNLPWYSRPETTPAWPGLSAVDMWDLIKGGEQGERPPAKWACLHKCVGRAGWVWGLWTRLVGDGFELTPQTSSVTNSTDCGRGIWESRFPSNLRENYSVLLSRHFSVCTWIKVYSLHSEANSIWHLIKAWIIYLFGLQVFRLTTIFIVIKQDHFDRGH